MFFHYNTEPRTEQCFPTVRVNQHIRDEITSTFAAAAASAIMEADQNEGES